MQNNRFMAVVAVAAGLVATGLAFAYIQGSTSQQDAEPMVSVLFVARDLPANHALDPDADLKVEKVGAISAPGLAQAAVKADEHQALRDRRISGPLPAGVPLMYSHLATIQDIQLAPDKRAMTINVGREGTLGGILVPGDRVDVLVSYKIESDGKPAPIADFDLSSPEAALGAIFSQVAATTSNPSRWEAREVLTDVRIIAVGNRLNMSRQQLAFGKVSGLGSVADAVTIEVSPEEARELIKATAGGANPLTLLLRPAPMPGAGERSGGLIVEEAP